MAVEEDDEELGVLLGVQAGVSVGVQESAHPFLVLLADRQDQVDAGGLRHVRHGHNLHLRDNNSKNNNNNKLRLL